MCNRLCYSVYRCIISSNFHSHQNKNIPFSRWNPDTLNDLQSLERVTTLDVDCVAAAGLVVWHLILLTHVQTVLKHICHSVRLVEKHHRVVHFVSELLKLLLPRERIYRIYSRNMPSFNSLLYANSSHFYHSVHTKFMVPQR